MMSNTSADANKPQAFKPPVPARPKHLVVLNSKHLPKPPDSFIPENVTSYVKNISLDSKNAQDNCGPLKDKSLTSNSDAEEDVDGYLEPISIPMEEPSKLTDIFRKVISRNSIGSTDKEVPEWDETKFQGYQSQRQRPLPSPPIEKDKEVTSMPWYKDVDRKKGEELLKNGVDGYFLIRPSSKGEACLTLTLWFHNRVYNIPIRKRRDEKFALGTPKANEQSFNTIQEMVSNYQSEKLVLYSNGAKAGRTLLTAYPP